MGKSHEKETERLKNENSIKSKKIIEKLKKNLNYIQILKKKRIKLIKNN